VAGLILNFRDNDALPVSFFDRFTERELCARNTGLTVVGMKGQRQRRFRPWRY
jgi:hypothetical protein